jgi:hypothetical protein
MLLGPLADRAKPETALPSVDDVNLPWARYDQGTFSAAFEEHASLSDRWKLIGGLSLDVIDKWTGAIESCLNRLLEQPSRYSAILQP